jgi:hypothetical protein
LCHEGLSIARIGWEGLNTPKVVTPVELVSAYSNNGCGA